MLLRLAYLGLTNAFALLRLLPGGDRDKDIEILSLRHQLDGQQVLFQPVDRAWLAALLHPLPRPTLRGRGCWCDPTRSCVGVVTCSRAPRCGVASPAPWSALHAAVDPGPGAAPGAAERQLGYRRRIHGELLTLGITVAPSTVWEILREAGIDPAPDRAATTWADVLRSQAEAPLAAAFLETETLTGAQMYILAVTEHATRRIRILGATTDPTTAWVTPAGTW